MLLLPPASHGLHAYNTISLLELVAADKRGGSGSPWSIPPSGNRQGGKPGGKQGKSGSGGGGAKRSSNSSSSSSSGSGNGSGRSKGKSASKSNVDSNAVGGSYGPPPLDAAPSPLQQHKLTPPLTPQLLVGSFKPHPQSCPACLFYLEVYVHSIAFGNLNLPTSACTCRMNCLTGMCCLRRCGVRLLGTARESGLDSTVPTHPGEVNRRGGTRGIAAQTSMHA